MKKRGKTVKQAVTNERPEGLKESRETLNITGKASAKSETMFAKLLEPCNN